MLREESFGHVITRNKKQRPILFQVPEGSPALDMLAGFGVVTMSNPQQQIYSLCPPRMGFCPEHLQQQDAAFRPGGAGRDSAGRGALYHTGEHGGGNAVSDSGIPKRIMKQIFAQRPLT